MKMLNNGIRSVIMENLMSKIFVTNSSKAKLERHSKDRINAGASPDLSWCRLVDSTTNVSNGLSAGCLFIPVGGRLPIHTHLAQEIYFVKSGSGILIKEDNQMEIVSASDVVFIPKGAKHGLKNDGDSVLEIIWIFPTDSWDDVEYKYLDEEHRA